MGRVMGIRCSLGSLGGSSGGVLGLDIVSESEVSSVDACAAGGCRDWVRALRLAGSWSAV